MTTKSELPEQMPGQCPETIMTAADQELAFQIKNEILDLCLKRKANALVALAAAQCAAECFEEIIKEQGGEVFDATPTGQDNARAAAEESTNSESVATQRGPFPDANTYPYPRLIVPSLRDHYPSCPIDCAGHAEYHVYEKERLTIDGKEHLVWKEIQ